MRLCCGDKDVNNALVASMSFWTECGTFWRETRRHFRTTGAVLPSSRFLARALTSAFRHAHRPARLLEVGPGTGSVTREVLKKLLPGDRLDCVELNSKFVERLRRRFEQDPLFFAHRERVRIIHTAVEELPGEAQYNYIISCLPFNSFPASQVRRIFEAYDRLLKPGGVVSYFEYAFARQMQKPFANRANRWRLCRVGRLVNRYIREYQVRRQQVLLNVPPAIVRHLHLKPELVIGH